MLSITVDTRALTRDLGAFARSQVPFATARALTDAANDARTEAKAALPKDFNIRTGWVAKGFRVERATKAHLAARLYHLDPFMGRQMHGGEKDGRDGSGVAIPAKDGFPSAPKRSRPTRPSDWPSQLDRTFSIDLKGGSAGRLVFQRTGKRRGKRGRTARFPTGARSAGLADPDVRLMYVIKPDVEVRPRWRLRETTARTVEQRFGQHFAARLLDAMRKSL